MATMTVGKDRELVKGLKAKGFTAKEVARICRLSRNSVNYLLYDKKHLRKEQAKAAAQETANEAIIAVASEPAPEQVSMHEVVTTVTTPGGYPLEIPIKFNISVGISYGRPSRRSSIGRASAL